MEWYWIFTLTPIPKMLRCWFDVYILNVIRMSVVAYWWRQIKRRQFTIIVKIIVFNVSTERIPFWLLAYTELGVIECKLWSECLRVLAGENALLLDEQLPSNNNYIFCYCKDLTWASWRLTICSATCQVKNNENIESPHDWPFVTKIHGSAGAPLT